MAMSCVGRAHSVPAGIVLKPNNIQANSISKWDAVNYAIESAYVVMWDRPVYAGLGELRFAGRRGTALLWFGAVEPSGCKQVWQLSHE
jgi:hypothetical protein